jgi:hypothetical protein
MATKPILVTEAIQRAARRILSENLPLPADRLRKLNDALTISEAPGMDWTAYLTLGEAFGIEGTLTVEFRAQGYSESEAVRYIVLINLNWSSMHRSVVQAQASIAIYQKLANLGAAIQCMFEDEIIVSKIESK